jgi:hypothetical protein
MIWLTPQEFGRWHVLVTCEKCQARAILFQDPTGGKGEFNLIYFYTCPECHHQGIHSTQRYWHPYPSYDLESRGVTLDQLVEPVTD